MIGLLSTLLRFLFGGTTMRTARSCSPLRCTGPTLHTKWLPEGIAPDYVPQDPNCCQLAAGCHPPPSISAHPCSKEPKYPFALYLRREPPTWEACREWRNRAAAAVMDAPAHARMRDILAIYNEGGLVGGCGCCCWAWKGYWKSEAV